LSSDKNSRNLAQNDVNDEDFEAYYEENEDCEEENEEYEEENEPIIKTPMKQSHGCLFDIKYIM